MSKLNSQHILIYIPYLDQRYGGIRQYTTNLLRTLSNLDQNKFKISVLHYNNDTEIIKVIKSLPILNLITKNEVKLPNFLLIKNHSAKKIAQLIQFFFGTKRYPIKIKNELDFLVEKKGITIIHSPYQEFPSLSKKIYKIATLHDVQELYFPEFFTAETRAQRAKDYLSIVKECDTIVVSYQHIKDDLVKYFNGDSTKIKVVLLPMNNLWFNYLSHETPINNDLVQKLPKDYILYPANSWKHKNHLGLIKAVKYIIHEKKKNINLILTGNLDTEFGNELKQLVKELGLYDNILFFGIVPEEVLLYLYKRCKGVVIPTLYEAGSFPLMESILLGVPVIASNVTSLPETIDNNEYVFDPNNTEELAHKLMLLNSDEDYRTNSILNSNRVK